jgi:hypothetical protein
MLLNDLAEMIALDGSWRFALGNRSQKEAAPWGVIQVPGCWEAQGYDKFTDGPAVYQRQVWIPKAWAGHTIQAEFGAVSYACTIRLNEIEVGSHCGLWTPFTVDLTAAAILGEENTLELRIFKPGDHYPMRSSLAGFIPDVSTTFGGIWQPVQLTALRAGLGDFWIQGDVETQQIQVHCKVEKTGELLAQAEWVVEVFRDETIIASQKLPTESATALDTSLFIADAGLWEPGQPILYTVQVSLVGSGKLLARASKRTGFRKLAAEGKTLLFNGRPCLLRGILSWGWDPDRIAPAYTPEQVREEIRRVRQLGFNLIKLCLFVPNPVYFDIADEEGMFLWLEYPMWLPEVTDDLRRTAPGEYAEITRLVQHHPSLILYSLGCELSQSVDEKMLGALDQAVRQALGHGDEVPDVLICDNSGSGESYGGLEVDFADFTDYHPYYDLHYFEPLLDHWRRDWQPARPWILGEFCDSDTFRDLGEIVEANGGSKPWWLTRENPVTTWRLESMAMLKAEPRLEQAQPGFTPQELVKISYAQSQVVRKYTLELIRRRAGFGGYVLTGLRDTPISTSGIWDDFDRPKWSAEEFRSIQAEAIICLDGGRRRRWQFGGDRPDRMDLFNHWSGETVRWMMILSQFSSLYNIKHPLEALLSWKLTDFEGKRVAGSSERIELPPFDGQPHPVGAIHLKLPEVQGAKELSIQVSLTGETFQVENHWPVWVYPALPTPPARLGIFDPTGYLDDCGGWLKTVPQLSTRPGSRELASFRVLLSTSWDRQMEKYVQNGGKVLLLQQGERPLPVQRCPFWREAIKLFANHALWEAFPQRGYTDLQFFGLASDLAFDTSRLSQSLPAGATIRPVMRRLDARQFHISEYLFEAQVGQGVLLACALRLQGGAGAQPYGWQRNVAGGAMLAMLLKVLTTE